MANTDELRAVCHRYIETFGTDTDAWADLFAEDAVQEDPVGTPANRGREAIRQFLVGNLATFTTMSLRLKEEPIVVGNEAAMSLEAIAGSGEARARIPQIVDVLTFDESGAITSLRAYWDMASIVPDPEG